jgi:RimJ/RimL family protein N-acetyltransferase
LAIRTPWIELRYPTDDLLPAVAAAAAAGIHPSDEMPFSIPWTRKSAGELERGVAQFIWSRRATLTVDDWGLPFVVLEAGQPVGVQDIFAKDFLVARTVETGSWLTRSAQGRGIGLEMRAAVLHLAFDALRADEAISGSYADNPRSEAVSRKAGYVPNGSYLMKREQQVARMNRWILTRDGWAVSRRDDITITGLAPCLPLLDPSR